MTKKQREAIEPIADINRSVEYLSAADKLYEALERDETRGVDPVYFLYSHAAELALKGVLGAHGKTIDLNHDLVALYAGCANLMVGLDAEMQRSIQGAISLLKQGNVNQGFRYFTLEGRGLPELGWTRDVVRAVVSAAKTEVLRLNPDADRVHSAVKFDFTASKREPKTK